MADRRSEIREQLKQLVERGERLLLHERLRSMSDEELRELADRLPEGVRGKSTKERTKSVGIDRTKLESFADHYQSWYSTALAVVDQLLPDRATEFRDLYRSERA